LFLQFGQQGVNFHGRQILIFGKYHQDVRDFEHRPPGNIQEIGKVGIGETARALGDILRDAQRRSPQLFGKTKESSLFELISKLKQLSTDPAPRFQMSNS
jgi:hypothetical protein